ncbi:MAG: DUF362 domain-containing protein [Proteobacteria bacterium]|nr:DUF362 domain-containing protein [Pseudomonadota bacterium]
MNKELQISFFKLNKRRAKQGQPPLSRREFLAAAAVSMAGLSIPFASCDTKEDNDGPKDTDSGSSSDLDSNTDSNSDTGSDADADTDSDSDTNSDTTTNADKFKVFVVKASDRLEGLSDLLSMTDLGFAAGKKVVLKPNFNSANSFPASTHDDTIRGVVGALKEAGSSEILLSESSGPDGTGYVISQKGTLALCTELGIEFVNLDKLPQSERENFHFDGMTWQRGMLIPKMMRSDNAIVLLPCCKTHDFGGHFTLSLKLAVGLIPRSRRNEMHLSSNIRARIADINWGFTPDLIVMDALKCFISGGPDTGKVADPGLLLAGTDRVAIDAVGVAVLRLAGSNVTGNRKIFEQDQIARAVKIGLGASSPDEIELVGEDQTVISELRNVLDEG